METGMANLVFNLNLESLGIKSQEIFYNLSYDELCKHETDPALTGYERVQLSELGAVNADTGQFTGRSAKDKYFVVEETSKDHIWWGLPGKEAGRSDNKPLSIEAWAHLKKIAINQLTGRRLYVMDGFCGANADTRLGVRLVTEVAWMAHFFKNMFIRPTSNELINFQPDWTILNACKATCPDFKKFNMHSE